MNKKIVLFATLQIFYLSTRLIGAAFAPTADYPLIVGKSVKGNETVIIKPEIILNGAKKNSYAIILNRPDSATTEPILRQDRWLRFDIKNINALIIKKSLIIRDGLTSFEIPNSELIRLERESKFLILFSDGIRDALSPEFDKLAADGSWDEMYIKSYNYLAKLKGKIFHGTSAEYAFRIGFFNNKLNQLIEAIPEEYRTPENICNKILEHAQSHGVQNNLTVLVIKL